MTQIPSGSAPQKPANAAYFPALDGIRALALAMVFLAHYDGVVEFGVGVNIFFVLSGFLITGILYDTRDTLHRVRNFYLRRTLRIFPLYYGIFLVLLLLTPLFHWAWTSPWMLWPAYLGNFILYMPEWLPRQTWMMAANGILVGNLTTLYLGHFWSLCVEEQFYLIWPWIVFATGRKRLLWICGLVTVVLPFLRVFATYVFPPAAIRANVMFRTLPFQMDALLVGGMLALLLRGQYRPALMRVARFAGDGAMLMALVFVYCCVDLHIAALHQPFIMQFGPLSWQLTVVNLLGVALILGALQPASWTYRAFNLRPLRWVGRISYGAYVYHDIPHTAYARLGGAISSSHPIRVTALIAATVTLLVSAVSYRFFEKPFLNLKERWTLRA